MPGLDISDHCYRCRQDSLCKRLLVQRLREMLRSTSTSPISSEGALSSDEEDEILSHIDAISTLGKGFELRTGIAVADIDAIDGDEVAITLPSTVELMA
jgi:glycerol-3-phosphate O-acyltransferase